MFRATPLKIALLESGISGAELGRRIGKHESTISRIVNGLACDDETKQAIADVLGRPIGQLWPGHDAAVHQVPVAADETDRPKAA
jgi:transcriptional regulator with XRE-family HTH domain